jgi:hypothetical protein
MAIFSMRLRSKLPSSDSHYECTRGGHLQIVIIPADDRFAAFKSLQISNKTELSSPIDAEGLNTVIRGHRRDPYASFERRSGAVEPLSYHSRTLNV